MYIHRLNVNQRDRMRQQWVMANWKMNGNQSQIYALLHHFLEHLSTSEQAHCVIFPPAVYLPLLTSTLKDSKMHWGPQNIYPAESGAYTGEISSLMAQEYHSRFVLVGHSERRQYFAENENFVAKKFHHVKDHDMIPVLCVGESLQERQQGLTKEVIARQLLSVTDGQEAVFNRCVIAYEPVWAIGTGQTASTEQVQEVHAHIRQVIATCEPEYSARVSILYGGSVNAQNAASLFSMPDVDGGLVGGASLDAEQFVEIVKCIS